MDTRTKTALTFGDLLRQYRRAAHLTQEQLAERSGMSVRAISDLERGARQAPHRDTLRLLVEALNLSADGAVELEAAIVRLRARGPGGTVPPSEPPPATGTPSPAAPPPSLPALPPLPAPLTSFVGREAEVAAAVHLLRRGDVRLLTLLGPAGVGKTRLALRTAEVAAADFADGVIFVALAPLTDPALVLPAIAHALDIKETGASLIAALGVALRQRRMLLLLDNFEQVAAAGPEVVALLQSCPGLVALVTSRAALAVQGEQQLPVPPLAVPESRDLREGDGEVVTGTVAQYPAVRLLIERVQAVKPDFAPTPETLPALVEISRQLDGLPLAIELAAPRLKMLSPRVLLARLQRLLPTLIEGARDLPERQRTMRATIAWSEGLLTEPPRTLFRRLAVFAGGWMLEAAEAVCLAPPGSTVVEMDALEGVSALVDHSLVQEREEDGETRFSMLHVIREYALDQLEASGEADATRRAHAEYYRMKAQEWRARTMSTSLTGDEREAVFQQKHLWAGREYENLRGALGWAQAHGEQEPGLGIACPLMSFWMRRGAFAEGRRWFEALLALPPPADEESGAGAATDQRGGLLEHKAFAYFYAGTLASELGRAADLATAVPLLEEGVKRLRAIGSLHWATVALGNLAHTLAQQGELDRAESVMEECLRWARQEGLSGSFQTACLSEYAYQRGDIERAQMLAEEALLRASNSGEMEVSSTLLNALVHALAMLARVAMREGDMTAALARGRETLQAIRVNQSVGLLVMGIELLAAIWANSGQFERAARLEGFVQASLDKMGVELESPWGQEIEETIAASRTALGESGFAVAYAAGQTLSLDQAIAEALSEQITPANSADRPERPVLPAISKPVQTRP